MRALVSLLGAPAGTVPSGEGLLGSAPHVLQVLMGTWLDGAGGQGPSPRKEDRTTTEWL